MHKLVEFALEKIGCGYVFGSQGEVMTEERIDELKKIHGSHHYDISDNVKASKWIGKECYDCSGLIVAKLLKEKMIEKDYTAQSLFGLCDEKQKTDILSGDLCFIKDDDKITHVGIYVGNGYVVEAQGTAYGVAKNELRKRPFNLFGRLKMNLEASMTVYQAIDILSKAKLNGDTIINSPDKWKNDIILRSVNIANLSSLIIKMAKYAQGKGD